MDTFRRKIFMKIVTIQVGLKSVWICCDPVTLPPKRKKKAKCACIEEEVRNFLI